MRKRDKMGKQELIKAGANIKAKTDNGYTALMYAANEINLEIIEFLKKHAEERDKKISKGMLKAKKRLRRRKGMSKRTS